MHPHHDLIETFYSAFQQRNYARMIACYTPDIEFNDPVFPLKGKRAGAMWHMLCEGGKDLTLDVSNIRADDNRGSAHWEAQYTFSTTGRKVHNIIDAQFEFRDGRIARHTDRFNFWRWSSMALGPIGMWLGWTPLVHQRVQKNALGRLAKFIEQHPEYQ